MRRSATAHVIQRLMLSTARSPLRPVWQLAYAVVARLSAAYLTAGRRGASAYLRANAGGRDFLPGRSDIDLAIVVPRDPAGPGRAREDVNRRLERLRGALPAMAALIDAPRVYEQPDLLGLAGRSSLTYGLGEPGGQAAFFGPGALPDRLRWLERPGLGAPAADWRLVKGPDRRPPAGAGDEQQRRIAAWLELVSWWQWAFRACLDPATAHTAHLCVKLVAEPVRIWLWLAHDTLPASRAEALELALRLLPEEEPALRGAIALQRALPRAPEPPLAQTLPFLVRMSTRIAGLLDAAAAQAGAIEVRLEGRGPVQAFGARHAGGQALALCDWRAIVRPGLPDDAFVARGGDPAELPSVRSAAAREWGPYPALRADRVLVMPGPNHWRTRMRAVQCEPTDPVSFALLAGRETARFPELAGWSAGDVARRAVAEQRAALDVSQEPGRELGTLLTAARAFLFAASLREGAPRLYVDVAGAAGALGARSGAAATIAGEAIGHYRAFAEDRTAPPQQVVEALRELVLGLAPDQSRSTSRGARAR